jgi:hypothetical protein
MYKEVIEVALKDLFDHFWQEKEYPGYDQHMVIVPDAFWGARMEQMCSQLDKDVALPPCIGPVTHDFMRTHGCDDDEITMMKFPLPCEGRILSLTYPPRQVLSGVLRAW